MEEPRDEMDVLIELFSKLNDRLADYQVSLGLVEHAVATFAFNNDPKAITSLTSSSPNTNHDLISGLKMVPSKTGPHGFRIKK